MVDILCLDGGEDVRLSAEGEDARGDDGVDARWLEDAQEDGHLGAV